MDDPKRKTTKIILLVFLALIIFVVVSFAFIMNKWSAVDSASINCGNSNLIKVKDVEGNTFVFADIQDNKNLKTNSITFNEQKLGIKSLGKIKTIDSSLNYISKNSTITYNELKNLQDCYKQATVTISNNYDFGKSLENKFCSIVFQSNESYKIDKCE